MSGKFSVLAYILCCLFLIAAAFSYPKWQKPQSEATISWDVSGYYFYLPAFLIYKDAKKLEFREKIIENYKPTTSFYQAYSHESGNWVMKYPLGMAVLYSPFFAVGHAVARFSDYPADGFSRPYQVAISWGSLLVAFLGLWWCRKNLLTLFSETTTGIVLLLLTLGTNYLEYAAISNAMPHNYLFTLHTFLIAATINWHKRPTLKKSAVIGVCIGLAALARPTEIIVVLLPLLWGIERLPDWKQRLQFFKPHFPKLLLAGSLVLFIGFWQIAYWLWATGSPLVYSYEDQGFSWLNPHFFNTFFSYRKGWLVYTPLMVFALIGFVFLWKKYRSIFWAILAYLLMHGYITCAWDIWWYGGSFGQRAMVQSYAALVFPLAACVEFVWQKNWRKVIFLPLCFGCIALNLFQTWQAHYGPFEAEAMTEAYYWRSFGKAVVSPLDKKLLDTEHDFQGERTAIDEIYHNPMDNLADANFVSQTDKGQSLYLKTPLQASPVFDIAFAKTEKSWIRISADFRSPVVESSPWHMPQLQVRLWNGEERIEKTFVRPHRFMVADTWNNVWLDLPVPDEPFDRVEVQFINARTERALFVDNLRVEVYNEAY